jgi:hypothetical protein
MTLISRSLELCLQVLERSIGVTQNLPQCNALPVSVQEVVRAGVVQGIEVAHEQG